MKHSQVVTAFVFAGLVLYGETAPAQQDLQQRKAELEVRKLELEIAKLNEDRAGWYNGITVFLSLLTGIAGGVFSFWAAHRARVGALDQATHQKRLESYPELVAATSRLAIYFPAGSVAGTTTLDPHDCRTMGRAMSEWYFDKGGLLLSDQARNAYFKLVRALTRAASEKALKVPTFPQDAEDISSEKLERYRTALTRQHMDLNDVEKWTFGGWPRGTPAPVGESYFKFQDYVFLQQLSSLLRTALSEDLGSRRRPS